MKNKIEPIGKRIMVKQTAAKEKTAGGLYIPQQAKEKPMECVVVSISNYSHPDPEERCPVKVGDTILVSKYGGVEIAFNGEDYKLVAFDDILARV